MSLPRYPEYKDSGAQWIGEVPAHWPVLKVKAFTEFCGGGTPSRDNLAYWNGDIPWISPKDMKSERITGAEECITSEGLLNSSSSMVDAGRLLMVVRSGILKHTIPVAINDLPVALNQDMKALRFSEQLATSDFFLRWVQGLNDALLLAWAKQGATVESIEHAYLAETLVPLPTLAEQHAIATFLDRETAKIDALIAEQEKLLALLAEKRQATISHAVTRGLNPNAPMKDSGISWLGAVPAHWEMRRLKALSPAITVGIVVNPSDYISDAGLPFIYGGDISEGHISITSCRRIDPSDSDKQAKTRLSAGDLLTVRVGAPGVTAVVPEECAGGNCASVMLIRSGGFNSNWLCYAMNSRMVRYQVEVVQYGAAQEQFNIGHAINFWIATPPREEQDTLAAGIGKAVERIDALKGQVEQAIGLLRERRSALISAAVSGKVDVREFALQGEVA